MLNYYEKVAEKDRFIMDVKKENELLVVTFADGSIRYFENNENTKNKINKVRKKQVKKLLKEYNSKDMEKNYNRIKKKMKKRKKSCYKMLCWLLVSLIINITINITSLGIIISLSIYGLYITIYCITASMIKSKLKRLRSQIEEVEKLELFQKERGKINSFVYSYLKNSMEQLLKQENDVVKENLVKQKENIMDQVACSLAIPIYDLDDYTLEQLKQILKEIEINKALGNNWKQNNEEQMGYQKSKYNHTISQ